DIQLRAELLELSHTAFSAIIRGVSIDKIRLQEFSSPDAFLFEECDPRTDVIPVWPAAHEIDHALESAVSADRTGLRSFVGPESVIRAEGRLVVADVSAGTSAISTLLRIIRDVQPEDYIVFRDLNIAFYQRE